MKKKEIVYIPIEKLHPNLNNPRRSNGCIKELADSIKANGVLQNLTVVPGTGRYMNEYVVVAGHRRLAASKAVGLTELPCVVEKLTKVQQIDIMLAENEQRNDLTYIERSNGYHHGFNLNPCDNDELDFLYEVLEKFGYEMSKEELQYKNGTHELFEKG